MADCCPEGYSDTYPLCSKTANHGYQFQMIGRLATEYTERNSVTAISEASPPMKFRQCATTLAERHSTCQRCGILTGNLASCLPCCPVTSRFPLLIILTRSVPLPSKYKTLRTLRFRFRFWPLSCLRSDEDNHNAVQPPQPPYRRTASCGLCICLD